MRAPAAFAIPGDIDTLTGGYIYERSLLEGLRAVGHDVLHLPLGASFPEPSDADMAEAVAALAAVDKDCPLILDGLVFGAIDTAGLAKVTAPIVAMIHHPLALESGLSEDLRDHLFRTEWNNLRLADHVLVPSAHTRSILIGRYNVEPGKITIVRPGVVPPSGPSIPVEPPLILSVGILHPRKGHDILIEALGRIRHLDWTAVIVGSAWDAAHAEDLAREVARLTLGDRVHLAGRISTEDLQGLYRAASIFALATRYEGYGMVFDEAVSYGLPIVSCRTGAVPDTVPRDAGLLVPSDNPVAFADAMARLLGDGDLRQFMSDAALRAAAKAPDWAQQSSIASKVLDGLAAKGR
ncbi:glycosyltransferase family 4 protein [Tropicimonas sp. IMCC34043]|uniref:glycosyltransferase family 4 protein n=1 Tax=Tropicimonas sp. IMCC34043 TaxID=2248760 RepID=UPI000E21E56C|nr:glycosyltransferase family 4 protein [Tropicimonas sp. IMCC34043]